MESPQLPARRKILCFCAAFKAHVAFGFWRHQEMERLLASDGVRTGGAMGPLGRLRTIQDFPTDATLRRYVKQAVKLQTLENPPAPARTPRPELPLPRDLASALQRNPRAAANWAGFSPSERREYLEWIADAKREETREQRLLTTVEWVAEGKRRHWKHLPQNQVPSPMKRPCLLAVALLLTALPAFPADNAVAEPPVTNVNVPTTASELAAGYAGAINRMSLKSLVIYLRSEGKIVAIRGIRSAQGIQGMLLITFSAGDMMAVNAEHIVMITDGTRTP